MGLNLNSLHSSPFNTVNDWFHVKAIASENMVELETSIALYDMRIISVYTRALIYTRINIARA